MRRWRLAALLPGLLALGGCRLQPEPFGHCGSPATLTVDGDSVVFTALDCGGYEGSAEAVGDGVTVELLVEDGALVPVVTAGPFGGVLHGVVLRGAASMVGEAEPKLWREGYQSWSFSGVVALEPWELDERGLPRVGGDSDAGSFLRDTPWTSWWHGLVGRVDGASVLLGALGAERWKVHLAAQPDALWVIWGTRGEEVTLAPDEATRLEPLWFGAGLDPWVLHARYADRVAERSPPPTLAEPDFGWGSWYVFYEDVVEDDIRRNAAVLRGRGEGGVLQVDDGWQRVWGDWQADEGFPSGMSSLASDLADDGFQPGLWMAPLYVDRSTATYVDHPDWWVRDRDGVELRFTNLNSGDYAVLDVTQPQAGAWLEAQIAARVAEGWTYLKLDFLYAAAQEGLRSSDVTGLEAFALALERIRDGAGGATLLASGSPVLPSVGWFHAFRSGADAAFSSDPDPRREYLRWQVRSTAARGWMNGRWWWNDPDALLVRDPWHEAEARGAVVANVVSGGAWLLGDDLSALPGARLDLALHAGARATMGGSARPERPLSFVSGFESSPILEVVTEDDRVPVRWSLASGELALLNLTDRAITTEAPAGTELLTGAVLGEAADVTLEPGDGQLWRPQL